MTTGVLKSMKLNSKQSYKSQDISISKKQLDDRKVTKSNKNNYKNNNHNDSYNLLIKAEHKTTQIV